jgi:hypothetical protein
MDLMESSLVCPDSRPAPNSAQTFGTATPAAGLTSLPIGRPLSISVPAALGLLPGEQVDLRFLETKTVEVAPPAGGGN